MEMLMTLQYVVVFMEYVTKWVEVYPVEDQASETIARLLIVNVVCQHGVPNQLLSRAKRVIKTDVRFWGLRRSMQQLTTLRQIGWSRR